MLVFNIGYRLGALGFLLTAELAKEAGGAAGNWGLRDQLFALKWIRRNAVHFGAVAWPAACSMA